MAPSPKSHFQRVFTPFALLALPDGDLLVTERTGTLHLRDASSGDRVEVEIPGIGDNPPFFTLKRSRPDHKAEMIALKRQRLAVVAG